jgi:hypothetical protein
LEDPCTAERVPRNGDGSDGNASLLSQRSRSVLRERWLRCSDAVRGFRPGHVPLWVPGITARFPPAGVKTPCARPLGSLRYDETRKPCGDLISGESVSPCPANPLWRRIRKPEASNGFCGEHPRGKPVHLYPIEADLTPLPYGSKGYSDRKPGEPEPGLQGGQETRAFGCRKGREMGSVGDFWVGLSPPAPRESGPAETRTPSGKTGPAEAAFGRPRGTGGVRARGLSRAPTPRGAVRGQDGEDQHVPGRPVGRRPVLGQLLVGLATDDDRIGGAKLLQPMRPGLASGSNRPSSRSMTPSTFTCADTISRPIRTFLPSRGLGATPGR